MTRALRPVVFDLDGVLVDSEPLYEAAFRAYVSSVDRADLGWWFRNTVGRRQRDFVSELADEVARPAHLVSAALNAELARLLDRSRLTPMPFAREVVRRLHAGGRAIGRASSSPRAFIVRVESALGLDGSFDVVVSGDEAKYGKPHPELYLTAADRMGVRAGECVAVEDTPTGVAAANAAGMFAIAVPNALTRGQVFAGASALVSDLRDAEEVIHRLDDS
jgi:HAD superfamily hydrolase (TIGR01509 family)